MSVLVVGMVLTLVRPVGLLVGVVPSVCLEGRGLNRPDERGAFGAASATPTAATPSLWWCRLGRWEGLPDSVTARTLGVGCTLCGLTLVATLLDLEQILQDLAGGLEVVVPRSLVELQSAECVAEREHECFREGRIRVLQHGGEHGLVVEGTSGFELEPELVELVEVSLHLGDVGAWTLGGVGELLQVHLHHRFVGLVEGEPGEIRRSLDGVELLLVVQSAVGEGVIEGVLRHVAIEVSPSIAFHMRLNDMPDDPVEVDPFVGWVVVRFDAEGAIRVQRDVLLGQEPKGVAAPERDAAGELNQPVGVVGTEVGGRQACGGNLGDLFGLLGEVLCGLEVGGGGTVCDAVYRQLDVCRRCGSVLSCGCNDLLNVGSLLVGLLLQLGGEEVQLLGELLDGSGEYLLGLGQCDVLSGLTLGLGRGGRDEVREGFVGGGHGCRFSGGF
jgi:hypothetical protein